MSKLNRRKFIRGAAIGAASMPLFAIGKPGQSANSKINVAVVGAGGQGGYAFRRAASEENLAAICDVDFKRAWRSLNKHPDVPRFTTPISRSRWLPSSVANTCLCRSH